MRIPSFAFISPFLLLAACGGPQTSQANNSQANTGNDPRTAENAVVSNGQARLSLGDASKIMHERHEGMETIGKTAKSINRELTGPSANTAVVRAGAAKIAELSQKASGWFPTGTGPEIGKTGAKPVIWQNPQDFSSKLHNFQLAAASFNASAAANDLPRIKAGFSDLQGTCKACHDKYRTEMHH